jgi:hypothetical protein
MTTETQNKNVDKAKREWKKRKEEEEIEWNIFEQKIAVMN